jgi:LmbE family N-acetylglucosaminyl deacetylase
MKSISLQSSIRRFYTGIHRRIINELDEGELKLSAVIFAPHPDDETLGCGGTILRKIQAGAEVTLVFMTDGSRSHASVITRERLGAIRKREAMEAAGMLGIARENVLFLDYENGRLQADDEKLVEDVRQILRRLMPEQIYVPCSQDAIADHVVANRVIVSAISEMDITPVIFEYPVWFWFHWPWLRLPIRHPRLSLEILRKSISAGFGIRILSGFRSAVYIGDVLERKRRVLETYRTQMKRMRRRIKWPILSDVGGGEFLRCFFQEYEYFHRYSWKSKAEDAGWPMVICDGGDKLTMGE